MTPVDTSSPCISNGSYQPGSHTVPLSGPTHIGACSLCGCRVLQHPFTLTLDGATPQRAWCEGCGALEYLTPPPGEPVIHMVRQSREPNLTRVTTPTDQTPT